MSPFNNNTNFDIRELARGELDYVAGGGAADDLAGTAGTLANGLLAGLGLGEVLGGPVNTAESTVDGLLGAADAAGGSLPVVGETLGEIL